MGRPHHRLKGTDMPTTDTTASAASAFFRGWRDLEAILATKGWACRASPAVGDGSDVLYFVPPAGADFETVQVRHLGKALQVSPWALRGSAGSMMALDPDTAAQVEARPPQWRVEALTGSRSFPVRSSFTLVCGDVLVALGLMAAPPAETDLPWPEADPVPETSVAALQARVANAAAHDAAFTIHDAGYSPDDFATTDDMVRAAAMMDELDPDDVSDDELQAVMAMPLDAPGRDEAMTRVFGDDRRNWPGDPADVDGPVFIGLDLGEGDTTATAYAYASTDDGQLRAWDGSPPYPADHPLRAKVAQIHARAMFGAALLAAKPKPPAWRRIGPAMAALGRAWARQLMGPR